VDSSSRRTVAGSFWRKSVTVSSASRGMILQEIFQFGRVITRESSQGILAS